MRSARLTVVLLPLLAAILETTSAGDVVCYYGSWASYRTGDGQLNPDQIDVSACKYAVYSFFGLGDDHRIKSLDPWNDYPDGGGKDGLNKFGRLTQKNTKLIPMIAVGGWNEGAKKYSDMAMQKQTRKIFVDSVVALLARFPTIKGLDVDWEYPAASDRDGKPVDRANFVLLLKELKNAFQKRGYILSVAVGVGLPMAQKAYDVKTISDTVHHINLMTYDFHMWPERKTGHNAPYEEVKKSVQWWINQKADKKKLMLGCGAYGRSFTLANKANNGPNAPAIGPGSKGAITGSDGLLGYNEICANKWPEVWQPSWKAPYAFKDNQWVGYDNVRSIKEKCKIIRELGLGGGMIWSIDTDDLKNKCGNGAYALTKTLQQNS